MISDLSQCKSIAKEWVKKHDSRCYQRGRKLGYMELMKGLWEVRGYEHLGLSVQNLRDKADHAEKRPRNADKESADCSRQGNIGSTLPREEHHVCNLQTVNEQIQTCIKDLLRNVVLHN